MEVVTEYQAFHLLALQLEATLELNLLSPRGNP